MWQMALLQLIHFGANAFSLWPHGGWCGWHDLSLQLSTVSSGGQSRLRSDSPTAKTQKVGCWHSNDSRNTDHTYEGLGCVWQEDVRSGRKGRVCLEECNKQANTLRTKKLRYRIYDRYRWEPRRHTHSHTDVWRQAGPLWVSPSCDTILFCYLTEGQQLVEGGKGEKDTPLLGWRETRKREPSPAPLFFKKKTHSDSPPLCKHVTLKQTRSPEIMKWCISMYMLNFIAAICHSLQVGHTFQAQSQSKPQQCIAYITHYPHETQVHSH